jgi:hypothetical protein
MRGEEMSDVLTSLGPAPAAPSCLPVLGGGGGAGPANPPHVPPQRGPQLLPSLSDLSANELAARSQRGVSIAKQKSRTASLATSGAPRGDAKRKKFKVVKKVIGSESWLQNQDAVTGRYVSPVQPLYVSPVQPHYYVSPV